MKRIVISDIHIGSKYYKAEELTSFLKNEDYDQLILDGDILDLIKAPIFTERAYNLLSAIDYSKEIIYVIGNHDVALMGFSGKNLFGIKFVESYEFEESGRKFRIEHGDKYETGLIHYNFSMRIISVIQDWLEHAFNVDLTSWFVNRKIKKRKLRRIWDILDRNKDVDVIVMGHSHCPEAIIWVDERQNIKTYVNSGDWVSHQSYVEIIDGVIRLRSYESENN